MATALEAAQSTDTAAARRAAENFRANRAALAVFQPELADRLKAGGGDEWVFARDGYLSSRTETGWWSGSSVPLRTGRQLLQKLDLSGTLGCFLNPSHAGQIRAGLEKIQPIQALLAVIPDWGNLEILLHCDDFAKEINAGRLFFVAGADWPDQLGALFTKYPGLPLPQQFLRTILLDDGEMNDLSSEAQRIISLETARRAERLPEILASAQSRNSSAIVVALAGSNFNLADLSNFAIKRALLENNPAIVPFDPDHPLTASSLALAEAAADADAVVAADLSRADLPGVVSTKTAWLTWITVDRIPAHDPQAHRDALLLADSSWRQKAIDAGWPADRIQIAGWPRILPAPPATPPVLGILTNLCAIEIPQKVQDFSSQLLLWEFIENELAHDPLALGDNPERYLNSRMGRFNIHEDGFDRPMFFDRLIAPAYKRGLARFLIKNGIRLALFGRGWAEIPEFKAQAIGAIENIDDLTRAVTQCRAVLQPYPVGAVCDGLPVPIVRTVGLHPSRLLGRIRQMLTSNAAAQNRDPILNSGMIAETLSSVAPPATPG